MPTTNTRCWTALSCGRISTAPELKKPGQDEAIGRSKGGLSTKIHATTDALGNPTGFLLTPGQASDREGADALLPVLEAKPLLADQAYDADERGLEPLQQAGKTAVIPPKRNRVVQRPYDQEVSPLGNGKARLPPTGDGLGRSRQPSLFVRATAS